MNKRLSALSWVVVLGIGCTSGPPPAPYNNGYYPYGNNNNTPGGTVIPNPPVPTPTSSRLDAFGIAEMYATAPGGREWYLPQSATQSTDEWMPGDANFVRTTNENGSGIFEARTQSNDTMVVSSPGGRPWWRNVEMTGYFRVNRTYSGDSGSDSNDGNPHITFFARGERHTDQMVSKNDVGPAPWGTIAWPGYPYDHSQINGSCLGTAYKGTISSDGHVSWIKEISHTGGFTDERRPINDERMLSQSNNNWFGFKVAITNINGDQAVHLETFVDPQGIGNWSRVLDVVDSGSWRAKDMDAANQDGCINHSPYNYRPDQVINWAGPYTGFRVQEMDVDFKELSVREIAPTALPGQTQ